MYGVGASIESLDSCSIEPSLDEVRSQLASDFDRTKSVINPRHFEEVVASVFKDMGYQARVTGYSNDGGIDVILDGPGNSVIGVQVKRWRNAIGVDQIRELLGALVLRRLTDGLIITTSTFMCGAPALARQAKELGFCIELVNGQQFFQALGFLQRHTAPEPETLLTLVSPNQLKSIYSSNPYVDAVSSIHYDNWPD